MSEKRYRIGLKWRIIFVVIAVVLGVGLLWRHYINQSYAPKLPNPKMPSPNAFNYYLNAARSVKDADLVEWAISDAPAVKPGTPPPTPTTSSNTRETRATQAEKEALLVKNRSSLALLRKGMNYEYLHPPIRSFSYDYPQFDFQRLADLLILEAQVNQHRGEYSKALDSCIDCIYMANTSARGGDSMVGTVAAMMQIRAHKRAISVVPHLDSQPAKAAALRMEAIDKDSLSYADILVEDKHAYQARFAEGYGGPDWYKELASSFEQNCTREKILCYTTSRPAIMRVYTASMDQIIADTRKPYALKLPASPAAEDFFHGYLGLFAYYQLGCINTESRYAWEHAVTMNRLLILCLALRAYYLDHGSYPAFLQALTPSYLSNLPDDPFALKGTFKYKRSGSSYTLHSLGPDCRDDGGKAIGKPGHRRVKMDSRGDIVAGVNY